MEIGEIVAVGFLQGQLDEKCPFVGKVDGPSDEDAEDIIDDDQKPAAREQVNSGGKLGENLASGSPGAEGTLGGPFTAKKTDGRPAKDTKRSEGRLRVFVPGTDLIEGDEYPFLQAAHHLIPGNASLWPSELKRFMTRDGKVKTVKGDEYTLACHIGYNVNGHHNGVWLPGNYAIRRSGKFKKSPVSGVTWGGLEALHADWQMNYAASVSRAAGGQFHDTHTEYSESVKELLNKISTLLFAHPDGCTKCSPKEPIAPPYLIKERLYNISRYLKGQATAAPLSWKRPWFISDRWRDAAFSGGRIKSEFADAYADARLVEDQA